MDINSYEAQSDLNLSNSFKFVPGKIHVLFHPYLPLPRFCWAWVPFWRLLVIDNLKAFVSLSNVLTAVAFPQPIKSLVQSYWRTDWFK